MKLQLDDCAQEGGIVTLFFHTDDEIDKSVYDDDAIRLEDELDGYDHDYDVPAGHEILISVDESGVYSIKIAQTIDRTKFNSAEDVGWRRIRYGENKEIWCNIVECALGYLAVNEL